MNPPRTLPPPQLIDSLKEFERFARSLKNVKRVAVDIESDGFYVYNEKICLVQISTEKGDFIVDPLAVKDFSPLGPLFRDPNVEKVFHAGEYDVLCLKRDFGFEIKNVFDTMIASRALGEPKLGLKTAIEKHFGAKLSKKLQRANWGKRPLSPEQIQYARLDTHYLLRLRDILHAALKKKDLLHHVNDEFHRLERVEPSPRTFDPEGFWHLGGAKALTSQERAVLRTVYLYREKKAAQLDRAPFRVLPEQLLVRIAEICPKNPDALRKVKGMTPYLFRYYGPDLVREIAKGLGAAPVDKPPERPPRTRWDGDTMRRYEALREWRKKAAEERRVHPIVILATEEVRQLAQAPRNDPDAGHWLACLSEHRRKSYGSAIMEVLKQPQPTQRRRRRRRGKKSSGPGVAGQSSHQPAGK